MKFKALTLFILIISLFSGCIKKTEESTDLKPINHFQFKYSVKVPYLQKPFSEGEIFVPIPQTNDFQVVHNVSIKTNGQYEILQESEYKNNYARITFSDSLETDLNFTVIVDITRELQERYTTKQKVKNEQPNMLQRYLKADSLVPIDGVVAKEAAALISDSMESIEKAKALYDNIFQTMSYDKSGEGWGRGDAQYACDIRKGNCTDFHSLFIGMARSVGIPARFLIGFPLPENELESTINGYHCWAEFYIDGYGWIPVDISEAVKNPDKKEFLFGNLDYNRLAFSIGRDIKIKTDAGEKSINFFIYPQVFIDGKPYDKFEKKFEFKRL